ncbi:MAG: 30S ribosomal protein S16 [Planctomycetota bacterium]|nr:MAG: 30S ribosomal protein S16 [Planctomycetota bacterium]
MVRLRLQRFGRTHRPFYRICAINQRNRRDGKVIENLGWFNPIEKDEAKQIEINAERVKHWLSVGAQPTETVEDILGKLDLLPPKRKATWEKRRADDRARVTAKVSLKTAEDAVAALGTLMESAGADLSSFQKQASDALSAVKQAVSQADVDAAAAAANQAKAALDQAKAAEEQFQAKKKAEEQAAAESSAEGESAEESAE